MTGGQQHGWPTPGDPTPDGRAVDVDLVADYVGGALDDTPEYAEVAELIRTDPEWAAAHRGLVEADRIVRGQLAELSGVPEPMPSDVLFRLTGAIRAAGPPDQDSAPGQVAHVGDLADARSRRRRHARWTMAAAVVILLASLGLLGATGMFRALTHSGDSGADNKAASSGDQAPAGAPAPTHNMGPNREKVAPRVPGTAVTASGRDYTPDSLDLLQRQPGRTGAGLDDQARSAAPSGLDRLAVPAQRDGCLDAVRAAHQGKATLVDYARFRGDPALVIELDRERNDPQFVVVGPDCGMGGAHELYATR
ncbi:MAG: hypothetical protein WCA46_15780 [Actinocatenispora sp.]